MSGDPTALENLTSTVDYKNVYKGTDFQYILGPAGIKENIILKSDKSPSNFTSVYKANGLVPVQIDDKTIEMRDSDGKVIYTLTAPFMEDAQGNASAGITLALIESKNNTFTVKTTLDEAWLNEQSREYPVTVDPVLKTEQSAKMFNRHSYRPKIRINAIKHPARTIWAAFMWAIFTATVKPKAI